MLDLVTVDLMKDRFERYKRCGDILVDYDEILLYYPDYFKKKGGSFCQAVLTKFYRFIRY